MLHPTLKEELNIKLFLLLFFSLGLHASDKTPELAHPFFLLEPGEYTLSTKTGLIAEEHEYEVAKVVQDLFEYNHSFYKLASSIGLPGQRQLGLELSTIGSGELSKEYSSILNIPRQNISYRGFHAIEFFYQEYLKLTDKYNQLAFEVRLKGSPLNGKESNNTYQGKDISIGFFYSHLHENEWRIYGALKASIIGRKNIVKADGGLETIDAFSQFGNLLGLQWLQSDYWLEGNTFFYLTTDYVSKSANYNRITDKGFIVGGKFLFGYYIKPKITFTIEHIRQGQNFNVLAETPSEDKELEIETQSTQLGISWLF